MVRLGVSLLVFILLVSGCSPYTHISEIRRDPQEYQGRRVSIKGRVVETFGVPFIQKGMYQVDDGTGKVWVMSRDRMPVRGEEVTVKGEVKTGFTIHNRVFGTIIVEGEEKKEE